MKTQAVLSGQFEARTVAGSATCKQSGTEAVLSFKVTLFVQSETDLTSSTNSTAYATCRPIETQSAPLCATEHGELEGGDMAL